MSYKIYNNDCLKQLDLLEENSIDSIITDPPYELNFMGKGWDNAGISFQINTWQKCLRVLKPGGYLLAFGGSRTFHRIAVGIEDAGFEIRDTIMWLYGSGFPKSMDISKILDKRNGRNYNEDFRNYINNKRLEKNISLKQINELFGLSTDGGGVASYIFSERKSNGLPTKEQYKILKEILELDNKYDELINITEAKREVIGTKKSGGANAWINGMNNKENEEQKYTGFNEWEITAPSTDLAKQWEGWGTTLKPSFEPIIVARKPFKGSLVDNIIKYGVGGINIDECRVENQHFEIKNGDYDNNENQSCFGNIKRTPKEYNSRFPANTILTYDETDFEEVCGGFPKTKNITKSHIAKNSDNNINFNASKEVSIIGYNDSGSASRYFYCAKASKKDRDEGLEEFDYKNLDIGDERPSGGSWERRTGKKTLPRKNIHPTVKPTELMQYLVRLVSPKGATILDPFMGSGSTGKAVMLENKEKEANYKFIGIEKEREYCDIAEERIQWASEYKEEYKKENNNQISFDDYMNKI